MMILIKEGKIVEDPVVLNKVKFKESELKKFHVKG